MRKIHNFFPPAEAASHNTLKKYRRIGFQTATLTISSKVQEEFPQVRKVAIYGGDMEVGLINVTESIWCVVKMINRDSIMMLQLSTKCFCMWVGVIYASYHTKRHM